MVEFLVYYEDEGTMDDPRWVAWDDVGKHYIDTHDTQKAALKSAKGKAQGYADRHDVTARIEVYQKNGSFKKTIRVKPTR